MKFRQLIAVLGVCSVAAVSCGSDDAEPTTTTEAVVQAADEVAEQETSEGVEDPGGDKQIAPSAGVDKASGDETIVVSLSPIYTAFLLEPPKGARGIDLLVVPDDSPFAGEVGATVGFDADAIAGFLPELGLVVAECGYRDVPDQLIALDELEVRFAEQDASSEIFVGEARSAEELAEEFAEISLRLDWDVDVEGAVDRAIEAVEAVETREIAFPGESCDPARAPEPPKADPPAGTPTTTPTVATPPTSPTFATTTAPTFTTTTMPTFTTTTMPTFTTTTMPTFTTTTSTTTTTTMPPEF